MLLPSQKPSSSCSLLKFVYITSQLRNSLAVYPLEKNLKAWIRPCNVPQGVAGLWVGLCRMLARVCCAKPYLPFKKSTS